MEMLDNFKSQNIDINKLNTLIDIKNKYNNGLLSLEDAKILLKEKVKSIKPYEIAIAEQKIKQFDENECVKENIQEMLVLFEDILDKSKPTLDKLHPINIYYIENEIIKNISKDMERLLKKDFIKNEWLSIYDELTKWYKFHLVRKQNQLYSILEKKGFDRPTTTMWVLDDFIRDEIKELKTLLINDDEEKFIQKQLIMKDDILDLISKEENILYPTSLIMINDEEFENMKSGDKEIGFTFDLSEIENFNENNSNKNLGFITEFQELIKKYGYIDKEKNETNEIELKYGSMNPEQIMLIFKHMPVDFTFVDNNNSVKFYNDTDHRVFPRSKNVIGRDVKNCHPRKSVHLVEEIIEKFRKGEKDKIEFWIDKGDVFIYIYYVAVRDENGVYKGVLEMMQDCTHIRSLKGSRTLLTWDEEENKNELLEEEKNNESLEEEKNEETLIFDIENINYNTYLKDLLKVFPTLKTELPKINSKFKLLSTPLARVMLPTATIEKMAERSVMDKEVLLNKIKEKILELKNTK